MLGSVILYKVIHDGNLDKADYSVIEIVIGYLRGTSPICDYKGYDEYTKDYNVETIRHLRGL